MSSAFSFYSNVFGLVVGGVSLIVLVFAFCRSQLPSNKIKVLDELLDETQALVSSYVEKGYLPEEVRANIERRLVRLGEDTFDLRSQAYRATTFTEDYTGFFAGLSLAIGRACLEVKRLRAEVITKSEKERRRHRDNVDLLRELPFCERGRPHQSDALSHQANLRPDGILNQREANLDPFVESTNDI